MNNARFSNNQFWRSTVVPLIRQKFNNRCAYCKSTQRLEVHHISYVDQSIDNLVLVCNDCHEYLHLLKDKDEPSDEEIEQSLIEIKQKQLEILG